MSQMAGQIGPIRMHKKPTEANIRKAAKIQGLTAAAFMRGAAEEKAEMVIVAWEIEREAAARMREWKA